MDFLLQKFLGNTVQAWLIAVGVWLVVWALIKLTRTVAARRLRQVAAQTTTAWDDLVVELLYRTKCFFFWAVSLYAGVQFVTLPPRAMSVLRMLLVVAVAAQTMVWANRIINFAASRYRARRSGDVSLSTVTAITVVAKFGLFTLLALVTLDNLGVNITTLVASLGIGGVAVALAVQNILGDLFSSLSIMIDRPFEVGDFIVVDTFAGTVEHVGLKTTRVRSLSGEQLVFSNSDLLGSRLRNYRRMQERRVLFTLGVTYQTPHAQLVRIPHLIRAIITAQPRVRFDRAHFHSYGDFALNFEVVYYVIDRDYQCYMDTQQAINLAIYQKFAEMEIEFAYPTQTVFMEKRDGGVCV